jgi:hypothetical protein
MIRKEQVGVREGFLVHVSTKIHTGKRKIHRRFLNLAGDVIQVPELLK